MQAGKKWDWRTHGRELLNIGHGLRSLLWMLLLQRRRDAIAQHLGGHLKEMKCRRERKTELVELLTEFQAASKSHELARDGSGQNTLPALPRHYL